MQNAKQQCGKGNDEGGCCSYKYQFFKVKDNHISADQTNSPVKYFVDLHLYVFWFEDISFASQKTTIVYRGNAPPLNPDVPLYIYNCVFTI